MPSTDAAAIEHKIAQFGLPVRIPSTMTATRLFERIRGDKKKQGHRLAWTLLNRIGQGCHGIEVPSASVERVLIELGASA